MPKEQQSLLLAHFSPDVTSKLKQIEQMTGEIDIEMLDWTPIYQAWPELKKILDSCKNEIKSQKLQTVAGVQRPKLREYLMLKTGKQKKGAPVFFSPELTKVIDQYIVHAREDK